MKKILQSIIFLSVVTLIPDTLFSQGCSDAGVCSINAIKNHSFLNYNEVNKRNSFKAGLLYGIGERNITYINPYIQYSNLLFEKIRISGKLTYAYSDGELANTSNLSDFILTGTYSFFNKEQTVASIIAGAKIPLNSSDFEEDGNPLPMHYQSSLGTYDIILGVNYIYLKLGVSLVLQQPIVNSNENGFIASTDPNLTEYYYTSTNSYFRKGDLVNRISLNFPFLNEKFSFRPSILSIYHLSNDTYKDISGVIHEIEGSQGITVNTNVFLNYHINKTKQIELALGFPIVTRDSRPDGLTRELVVGLDYTYKF